jgi:hypothetical protein
MSKPIIQQYRGDGTTTRQMQAAPQGAIFIWCTYHVDYPKGLAHKIGRDDLVIVSPHWLTDMRWAGRELTGIVLDHALTLERSQWDELQRAMSRVR